MGYYAGIDVSLEYSTVCVVDATGKIVKHHVNFQPREVLGPEIEQVLPVSSNQDH